LFLVGFFGCKTDAPLSFSDIETITITDEMQYKWGDCGDNATGFPNWSRIEGPGWGDYDISNHPENYKNENFIWFRKRLPEKGIAGGTLVFRKKTCAKAFEVWLGGKLVYKSGKSDNPVSNEYFFSQFHIIDLPEDFPGNTLYFRVNSNTPARIGFFKKISIVPGNNVFRQLIKNSTGDIFLGLAFIVNGLIAILIFLFFKEQNIKQVLFFGLVSFLGGLQVVINSLILHYLVYDKMLLYYIEGATCLMFPAALWALLESTVELRFSIFFRRLWQIQLGLSFVAMTADILQISSLFLFLPIIHVVMVIGVLSLLYIAGVEISTDNKNSNEAKVHALGGVIYGLLGLTDLLHSMKILSFLNQQVSPWGLAAYTVCVYIIIVMRFEQNRNEREKYAARLEGYSRTLEEKVEARTQKLNKSLETEKLANIKIMDSIYYSKLIQTSLLLDEAGVRAIHPTSFTIWQPKDIVGGDMIFMHKFDEGFVLAVVDCTGHGLPVAFYDPGTFS